MCYVLVKREQLFSLLFPSLSTLFCYNFLEPPKGGGKGLMHVTRTLKEPHLPEHTC